MQVGYLLPFVIAGILLQNVNAQYGRHSLRKGECPQKITCYPITKYHKRCRFDNDCPRDHKCCSDVGDHSICQKVLNIPRYPGCPLPKKVSCIIDRGIPDERHTDCIRDGECSPGFKCCSDTFGHRICVQDTRMKTKALASLTSGIHETKKVVRPGVCPRLRAGTAGDCVRNECRLGYDQDCRRGEKCCFNGCSNICTRTQSEKSRQLRRYQG